MGTLRGVCTTADKVIKRIYEQRERKRVQEKTAAETGYEEIGLTGWVAASLNRNNKSLRRSSSKNIG